MIDQARLLEPTVELGTPSRSRTITLISAGGLAIPLLVPRSISANRTIALPTPITGRQDIGLRAEFDALVEVWRAETLYLSGADIELHPAYLQIIAMGKPAVPLILSEMRKSGGHFFRALAAITGKDPAQNSTTVTAATDAWLRWGRERGLLQS
jgi:hypothetical protein